MPRRRLASIAPATPPAAVHEADEWRKGRNLDEAMAAWAQLHFARDDLELFGGVS
jgi:hypothetical protein